MRRLVVLAFLVGMLLPLVITPQSVSAFSGAGSGTDGDPFVITNVSQLQEMNDNLTAYYELGGDIDASVTSGWNAGAGFDPIGSALPYFSGSFDGKGYKITSLHINRPDTDNVGLFATFAGGASVSITSVIFEDFDITGKARVGCLVGEIQGSNSTIEIEDFHVHGVITGNGVGTGGLIGRISTDTSGLKQILNGSADVVLNGYNAVGGIAGAAQGRNVITNCHTVVNITATANGGNLGGIYGYSVETNMGECSSEGSISSPLGFTQLSTGGLIGFASESLAGTYVYRCHADVNLALTGTGSQVGGLIGTGGRITQDSYALGDVNFPLGDQVGGLIGMLPWIRTAERCYSVGEVVGSTNVGGLIGKGESDGAIVTDCFWDTQTSGQATSDGGTGRETIYMTDICIYRDSAGWDIEYSSTDRNDGYPFLSWEIGSSPIWLITRVTKEGDTFHDADWDGSLIFSPGMDCPDCPPVSGGAPTMPANWFVGTSTDHLPLQESFVRASNSLGWTMANTYMLFILFIAIVFGIAVFAATGSVLFGSLSFGVGVAIGSGTGVVPMWVGLVGGLVCVMSIVVARST